MPVFLKLLDMANNFMKVNLYNSYLQNLSKTTHMFCLVEIRGGKNNPNNYLQCTRGIFKCY